MSETNEPIEHLTYLAPADLHGACEKLRRARRPGVGGNARRLLVLVLGYLCPQSGRVMLTRDQMARLLNISGEAVSLAITALAGVGVVRRERVAWSARGVPAARYYLNPHLAWSGTHDARQRWLGTFQPPGNARHHRSPDDAS